MEEIKLHQFAEKLKLFGYAERTIDDRIKNLRRFFSYLNDKENIKSVMDIQPSHVRGWQAYLTFEKSDAVCPRYKTPRLLSPGTVMNYLMDVRSFFRIMHQEKLLPYDYTSCIVVPKKRRPLPRNILTVEEMRNLLRAAVPDSPLGIRDRFILELLYATGIRNRELRTLTTNDISIQERILYIRGKGGKDRVVPLGNWVIPFALEHMHTARPYLARLTKTNLLLPTRRGRMIDASMLNKIVKEYGKRAGIVMNITPHVLRHTCATHLIQAGADIRYVQELLGHSDLSSTQVYTRVTIGDLKEAHAKYHPANREGY